MSKSHFLPKTAECKGGLERITLQLLTHTTLAMWLRSASTISSHVQSAHPWHGMMRPQCSSVSFLLKTQNPHKIKRRTSEKPQTRDILQSTWSILPQTDKAIKRTQKKTKKVWGPVIAKRIVGRPRQSISFRILEGKRSFRGKRRRSNKVWTSVNTRVIVLVHRL